MDKLICTAAGMVGSIVAGAFGGWSLSLKVLIAFMCIDYITGVITAICRKSPKTESGGLKSSIGLKGICKKVFILLFVVVAVCLDKLMGTQYIQDTVCIGFALNELLSIIENAGLMGIKLPKAITSVVELLRNRAGENDSEE